MFYSVVKVLFVVIWTLSALLPAPHRDNNSTELCVLHTSVTTDPSICYN